MDSFRQLTNGHHHLTAAIITLLHDISRTVAPGPPTAADILNQAANAGAAAALNALNQDGVVGQALIGYARSGFLNYLSQHRHLLTTGEFERARPRHQRPPPHHHGSLVRRAERPLEQNTADGSQSDMSGLPPADDSQSGMFPLPPAAQPAPLDEDDDTTGYDNEADFWADVSAHPLNADANIVQHSVGDITGHDSGYESGYDSGSEEEDSAPAPIFLFIPLPAYSQPEVVDILLD
ncbi:Uu.00g032520.m01.CDS01 [Anthostomella pinea]|uniref:Uu.00g032520.m01.CDS01 n=1 Tax=Anthostomella pinea TaxID=933095 RepID=A0AAI8YAS4_9PEZI|nr:Uu.00g032520.m01.CDS01 [Anthostomella pinea]